MRPPDAFPLPSHTAFSMASSSGDATFAASWTNSIENRRRLIEAPVHSERYVAARDRFGSTGPSAGADRRCGRTVSELRYTGSRSTTITALAIAMLVLGGTLLLVGRFPGRSRPAR